MGKQCVWLDTTKPGDSSKSGKCIHKTEVIYNALFKKLSSRGKKSLALSIYYHSKPAQGRAPYGPHGPYIIDAVGHYLQKGRYGAAYGARSYGSTPSYGGYDSYNSYDSYKPPSYGYNSYKPPYNEYEKPYEKPYEPKYEEEPSEPKYEEKPYEPKYEQKPYNDYEKPPYEKPYEHKYEPKPYNDYETPHYDSYEPYKPKYEYKQE